MLYVELETIEYETDDFGGRYESKHITTREPYIGQSLYYEFEHAACVVSDSRCIARIVDGKNSVVLCDSGAVE